MDGCKNSYIKKVCYGFGSGLPGYRLTHKCSICDKTRYIKLNLFVPDEDLYKEHLWRE